MNKLYLLNNIGLLSDYSHSIDFENIDEQMTFWSKRIAYSVDTIHYVRGNPNTIVIDKPFDYVKNFSYCAFKNNYNGTNKVFFAFIEDVKYNTAETTYITINIDVIQTYMFDYEILDSFIDREHKDRIIATENGLKPVYDTQPESLEIGNEYRIKDTLILSEQIELENTYPSEHNRKHLNLYIVAKNSIHSGTAQTTINGIPSGIFLYYTPIVLQGYPFVEFYNNYDTSPLGSAVNYKSILDFVVNLPDVIGVFCSKFKPDNVKLKQASDNDAGESVKCICYSGALPVLMKDSANIPVCFLSFTATPKYEFAIPYDPLKIPPMIKITDYLGLEPNKNFETKLQTYPYNFLQIEDTKPIEIKKELLQDNSLMLCTAIGTSVSDFVVYSQENYTIVDRLKINTLDTPQLNLKTDAWQEYKRLHSASLESGLKTQAITSGLSVGGGVVASLIAGGAFAPLAVAGAVGYGVSQYGNIKNEMLKRQDIKNTPDDIRVAENDAIKSFAYKTINLTDANKIYPCDLIINERIIQQAYFDNIFNYFMRFGYKSNRFGKPNLRSRFYYNFIKTIDINIKGNLNTTDLRKIQGIFNNGITFWHYRGNSETLLFIDYSKENLEWELCKDLPIIKDPSQEF